MITHTNYEEELMAESVAEVRAHWDGMFIFGAPDVMVVNLTKDAIWARKAAIPPGAASGSLDPRLIFPPDEMPEKLQMPDPARPREMQQQQFLRDMELDPNSYYPDDTNREISNVWPADGVEVDIATLLKAKGVDVDDGD
jgi:ribonuclease Z